MNKSHEENKQPAPPKFITQSDNQTTQFGSSKRPMPASAVDAFCAVTAKKDLYDHLEKQLQVSNIFIIANIY